MSEYRESGLGERAGDTLDSPEAIAMPRQQELLEVNGRRVVREISPDDGMFTHSLAYFAQGRAALSRVEGALASLPDTYPRRGIRRVLDLPCGYGRVLRFLRAGFPDAEITACDILGDGVDFCARRLGAVPVLSREDPRDIPLEGGFDLIWCGSLMTHLDQPRWTEFLDLFQRLLRGRGVLLFTFHGRRVADLLRRGESLLGLTAEGVEKVLDDYERTGFGYCDYPEQPGYGISLSAPSWVCGQLEAESGLRILNLTEMGWSSYGDVVSCVRKSVERVSVDIEGRETGSAP